MMMITMMMMVMVMVMMIMFVMVMVMVTVMVVMMVMMMVVVMMMMVMVMMIMFVMVMMTMMVMMMMMMMMMNVVAADSAISSVLPWLICLERGSGLCGLVDIAFVLIFPLHLFVVVTIAQTISDGAAVSLAAILLVTSLIHVRVWTLVKAPLT